METSRPTPMTARVYVNLPEGNNNNIRKVSPRKHIEDLLRVLWILHWPNSRHVNDDILTGAKYVGNGWVAGGCWDDYFHSSCGYDLQRKLVKPVTKKTLRWL